MPPEIDFYNPRSIILFFCLLQGVIFAFLLFVRSARKRNLSDRLLGVLLLVMCSGLVTHFIGFANVYDNNQWLTYFPFEFLFALAPLIYLYVQTLTNADRVLKPRDLLLFLPAIVYWVYFFILFLQPLEFKGWFGARIQSVYVSPMIALGLFIWNCSLVYLSIKHYRRYRRWLNQNYSDTELIKFNWLRNFLYIFAFVFIVGSLFDIASIFRSFTYIQAFYLKLIFALITYYLAIAGYMRSEAIKLDFSPKPEDDERILAEAEDNDKLQASKERLSEIMNLEKPYLDPQLTLKELSKQFGANTTVVSGVINKGFGKNFNDFINEYRIDEVKKRLKGNGVEKDTYLTIAFDCGFNSKATFNRAFKKFTGVSPKEYSEKKSVG